MSLPRESWIVLGLSAAALAVAQTVRLWWRGAAIRLRLADQSARALAGETLAEGLLSALGFVVLARQVTRRWTVEVDGRPRHILLRADLVVRRRRRTYVAEVKTGEMAPDVGAVATRRQLLEYRCAFGADGVLLVDAEHERVQLVRFPLPRSGPRIGDLTIAVLSGLFVGAALMSALAARAP